jgi:hypothetical protein
MSQIAFYRHDLVRKRDRKHGKGIASVVDYTRAPGRQGGLERERAFDVV